MTQNTQKHYVCTELVDVQGVMFCKTWQALDHNPSLPFTKEEANDITIAICGILVLVWGFKQAKKLIR